MCNIKLFIKILLKQSIEKCDLCWARLIVIFWMTAY